MPEDVDCGNAGGLHGGALCGSSLAFAGAFFCASSSFHVARGGGALGGQALGGSGRRFGECWCAWGFGSDFPRRAGKSDGLSSGNQTRISHLFNIETFNSMNKEMLTQALSVQKDVYVVDPPRPKQYWVAATSFLLNSPPADLSLDPRWFTLREMSVSSSEVSGMEAFCT